MSKAFTSEETPDAPPVVPPRAALPPGVPNYVTPRGLDLLRAELAALEAERAGLLTAPADAVGRRERRDVLAGRLADLSARIGAALVVDPRGQTHDDVRFGATVTVRMADGEERRFTIVGVDEADPAAGRVAFVAPIARAILGCRRGDTASFRTGRGEEELEVVAIDYA